MKFPSLAMALAVATSAPAAAHDYRLGALTIDHPVIRVASPVSKTGAGFMAITNRGTVPDRLVAVETAVSTRADLHGTISEGGIMKMRAQDGGVPIPPGATVSFAPGGLHVMFIGLKSAVPPGTMVTARLRFERAGSIDVRFKAQGPAAGPGHQH